MLFVYCYALKCPQLPLDKWTNKKWTNKLQRIAAESEQTFQCINANWHNACSWAPPSFFALSINYANYGHKLKALKTKGTTVNYKKMTQNRWRIRIVNASCPLSRDNQSQSMGLRTKELNQQGRRNAEDEKGTRSTERETWIEEQGAE